MSKPIIAPEYVPNDKVDMTHAELSSIAISKGVIDFLPHVKVRELNHKNVHVTLSGGPTLTGYLCSYRLGEEFTVGQSRHYNSSLIEYIREV